MVKHNKLMMAHDCDFIKMVSDIKERDGGEVLYVLMLNINQLNLWAEWTNWFIGVDKVENKTGDW